jgi:hypothetical protein
LAFFDDVNIVGENIDTINRNIEALNRGRSGGWPGRESIENQVYVNVT